MDRPGEPDEDRSSAASSLEALRSAVRDWSDVQLRRAWQLSAARLTDPAQLDQAAAQREVLLAEWERRHPRARADWDGFFLR